MKYKNIQELLSICDKRGTIYTRSHKCTKCGNEYFYTREGRKCSTCIWCANTKGTLPISITENTFKMDTGHLVYTGKKCRTCGNTERLAEKIKGHKEKACYHCAISKQSSKSATHQQNRLKQAIKFKHIAFQINSIVRGDSVDVCPSNWSEHYLVQALFEDVARLNTLEEINNSGVFWEIGHNYPVSGGGTPLRGKSTIENLFIIRRETNRSSKDKLPETWDSNQVIWIGDVYNTIKSSEAAILWRERMGISQPTKEDMKANREKEKAENHRHYQELKKLSADTVESLNLALSNEDEFQRLYDTVRIKLEKINKQMKQRIETARKNKESLWQTESGLLEEALHGIKARYRIIYNTIGLFLESVRQYEIKNKRPVSDSESNLVKRALVYWSNDLLKNPSRDIEGFTHPFLEYITEPKAWGIRKGSDGKMWLCGWLVHAENETIEIDITESDNADWVTMEKRRFYESERKRKDDVTNNLKHMVSNALAYTATSKALCYNAEIETPHDYFDDEMINLYHRFYRESLIQKADKAINTIDHIREQLNKWHVSTQKDYISASEVEKQSIKYIDMLKPYQDEPKAPTIYPYDVKQKVDKYYLSKMVEEENPF